MGIYDRDYYRKDGPSFLSSIRTGQGCQWLIIINIVVFVLQLVTLNRVTGRSWLTDALLLDVNGVLHGQVWRLLTYAFLHDSGIWQHIVFNMLFLWWFGADVEGIYGRREFLAFYLLAALVGGIAFVLTALMGLGGEMCLGASGAVTAVMVVCALHYPQKRILLMFILPVPIWAFVLFQFAQDTFIFVSQQSTTTAVAVHLGGALFGFCYYRRQWRVSTVWGSVREWQSWLFRPRLRVYRELPPERVAVAAPPPESTGNEQLEEQLDAVLEKVARFGQSSLTESERRILLRASEVYRRRRT